MKASAVAQANIALVKYWGKRDESLHLPANGSLSMTTEGLSAHTTVEFDASFAGDRLVLNGVEMGPDTRDHAETLGAFLPVVRDLADVDLPVRIESRNDFPTAAGLASSAAG